MQFIRDRAGDLANLVTNKVKWRRDFSGFVFNHTFRKTLLGAKRRSNMSVVKRCAEEVICPVVGLYLYAVSVYEWFKVIFI